MSSSSINARPAPDRELVDIAEYVDGYAIEEQKAIDAAQGSHPSDNLAGILMLADHLSRRRVAAGNEPLRMREVFEALVKAYEIQGCIAIENDFKAIGIDHFMDKTGPLSNPADRDHCAQYVVAFGLIFGRLTADDFEDNVAADPRIDALREKTTITV